MDAQQVINSRLGLSLAMALGVACPPVIGHPLARFVADRISARKDLPLVQAARLNQWVVRGGNLSSEELDKAVRESFRHTAHCIFEFYHHLGNREAIKKRTRISPQFKYLLQRMHQRDEGTLAVGVHLSNFDMAMHSVGAMGIDAYLLGLPQLRKDYQWQNFLRKRAGLEIHPASLATLKEAARRLQAGEMVATGIDRPIPDNKYRPKFFGRPAALPVHHVTLALKAAVPVFVMTVIMENDGAYKVVASDPIYMEHLADRHEELIHNAERILSVAEGFISMAPHQWAMFYPVWPEALSEVP